MHGDIVLEALGIVWRLRLGLPIRRKRAPRPAPAVGRLPVRVLSSPAAASLRTRSGIAPDALAGSTDALAEKRAS